MSEKRYNLKVLFKRGRVYRIEHGDFGPAVEEGKRVDAAPTEDFLASWPVNPEFTGKYGILSMLAVPAHDNVEFVDVSEKVSAA